MQEKKNHSAVLFNQPSYVNTRTDQRQLLPPLNGCGGEIVWDIFQTYIHVEDTASIWQIKSRTPPIHKFPFGNIQHPEQEVLNT